MTVLFLVPVFTSAIFRYLRMQLESDSSLLRSKSELKPCITAQQKTKRDNKDRLSGINFASRGTGSIPVTSNQIFL
jgi:Mg2+/Co2+ transporter CorB